MESKEESVDTEPKRRVRPRKNFEFKEARELVRGELLRSVGQYKKWWLFNTPAKIPKRPDRAYKHQWISWNDFLGSNNPFPCTRKTFRDFTEAKSFVHRLGLVTKADWFDYVRTGAKPKDIPTRPDLIYVDDWFTWRDFVGGDIPSIKRNIDAAGAVFFIIQNYGRPNNVYQLGITLESYKTILQQQVGKKFRIIGMYYSDIEFKWEAIAEKHGKKHWESGRRDEYVISNINDFIFDITDFVEIIKVER